MTDHFKEISENNLEAATFLFSQAALKMVKQCKVVTESLYFKQTLHTVRQAMEGLL